MNDMIYYPGFEIKNDLKLKFALLYFDRLHPIIPELCIPEENYLSEKAIYVKNNTDLIENYVPDYDEVHIASRIACEEFEKFVRHPERYFISTNAVNAEERIIKWQSPSYQKTTLYGGKYAYFFEEFCIENNIAFHIDGGLKINRELANVYMSLLADIISKHKGFEMFTDISKYSDFLIQNDRIWAIEQNNDIIVTKSEMVIESCIPNKLWYIPIDRIIDLRNDKDFATYRKAFNAEIDKYVNCCEQGATFNFDDMIKIKSELMHLIRLAFDTTAAIYLTYSSIDSLGNPQADPVQLLASAYESGSALLDIYHARDYVKELKTKIQAKRYLAKIRGLGR